MVVRLQPRRRGRPLKLGAQLFRSYSLSGPLIDRALSNQREDRAEWCGWNLPPRACPGGRCDRRQRTARKLHSAVRRAAGRAAQRGHRGDACAGDAVRTGGGPLDTTGLVAARGSRSGSIIRSPPKSGASMLALSHGRSYVCYSRPGSHDTMPEDFNATGHLSRSVFDEVGVPREADVYVCGPARFMAEMKEALASRGRGAGADSRRALQRQRVDDSGCRRRERRELHICPRTTPTPVRWCRSRAAASPHTGRRRPTRASWSWPRRATSRSGGRAGPVCATTVRAGWCRGRSSTDRSHSTSPPTATSSCAAHNRFATSSSICKTRRSRPTDRRPGRTWRMSRGATRATSISSSLVRRARSPAEDTNQYPGLRVSSRASARADPDPGPPRGSCPGSAIEPLISPV